MKYEPDDYLNSGFYDNDDTEIEHHQEKIVTCRKPHPCGGGCEREIQIGEQALCESGFMGNKPVRCYTCLPCIEAWLEESGQVEVGE